MADIIESLASAGFNSGTIDNALQGCATDGAGVYWFSTSTRLYRYTRSGDVLTLDISRDVTGDDPTAKTQINGLNYHNGSLWVGANDFVVVDRSTAGWIVEYDPADLTYIAHHSVGADSCEGGAWRGTEFWVTYNDHPPRVERYNSSFVLQATYYQTDTASQRTEHAWWQGASWVGDILVLSQHGSPADTTPVTEGYKYRSATDDFVRVFTLDTPGDWPQQVGVDGNEAFLPSRNLDRVDFFDITWRAAVDTGDHVATVTLPVAASDQDDVKVLLSPNSDAQWATFWATVADGGADMRVYLDDDETPLSREVVSCDTTAETGQIWVRVPHVYSGQTVACHIYADGVSSEPAADAAFGAESVWANGYGVWHMEQDPSGSAPQISDSTANGYHGTSAGTMTSGDLIAAGKIGAAIAFDGADDYISIGGFNLSDAGLARTGAISVWYYAEGDNAICDMMSDYSTLLGASLRHRADGQLEFYMYPNNRRIATATGVASNDAWHQLIGVFATTELRLYFDGAAVGTPVAISEDVGDPPVTMKFGGRGDLTASSWFDGMLAEVRVWKTIPSADLIAYEYANQDDPAGWYSVAAAGGGGFQPAWAARSTVTIVGGMAA